MDPPPSYEEACGQVIADAEGVGAPQLTWLFTERSSGMICLCDHVARYNPASDTLPTRMVFVYNPQTFTHTPLKVGSEKFWCCLQILNNSGLKCALQEENFVCIV